MEGESLHRHGICDARSAYATVSPRNTVPDHPTELLKAGRVARVPIMIGDDSEGASFLTIGVNNFTDSISQPPFNSLPPNELRALYPVPGKFETEAQAVVALGTDRQYRW
jgi:carboxylesterase type B